MRYLLLSLPVLLAACAPISPTRAADLCEEEVRERYGPQNRVTIGANSETGVFAEAQVGIRFDLGNARTPEEAYEACVIRRSGQPPIRPLDL